MTEQRADQPQKEKAGETSAAHRKGLRAWLKHAFAVEAYDESSLSEEEKQAIATLARNIHERGLGTPAIFWAQSNRHFNWVSSQFMVFFQPLFDLSHPFLNGLLRSIGLAIKPEDYPHLVAAFEKRYSIEYLIQQLEAHAAAAKSAE